MRIFPAHREAKPIRVYGSFSLAPAGSLALASGMADSDLNTVITTVLNQTPDWVRTEFASKDAALRERAAETLAAMLAAALVNATNLTFDPPVPN
jgi:hypothetical protein